MSQSELLKRVINVLDRTSVEYAVTGSWASSIQGEPRSTHDVDLIVALTTSAVPSLLNEFQEPEYLLQEQSIRDAIRTGSMFNLLWVSEGLKVDFWMLTNEPFDRSRFTRRRQVEVFGIRLNVTSPEDTILAKLRWSQLSGGSEKQFTDALRVLELQNPNLDMTYLDEWAIRLGINDEWIQLKSNADLNPS
jgi:hypothetical protein